MIARAIRQRAEKATALEHVKRELDEVRAALEVVQAVEAREPSVRAVYKVLLRYAEAIGEAMARMSHKELDPQGEEVTTSAAAAMLRVSTMTAIRWCEQGDLPFRKTQGGHRRIPLSAVVRLAARLGVRDLGSAPAPAREAKED